MRSPWLRVECVGLPHPAGSYAFFWHSRDWNTASRLILTYAMAGPRHGLPGRTRPADRRHRPVPGPLLLRQAAGLLAPGDDSLRAWPGGRCGFPAHPLDVTAMAYWPADYWVTLGTSGLFTALTAVLLMRLARDLGCSPRGAALVGLAYGLATPAYVYATLAYGHQLSAFALLASFSCSGTEARAGEAARLVAAGFLAAYAAVIELQVGPVSAILGLYLAGPVPDRPAQARRPGLLRARGGRAQP